MPITDVFTSLLKEMLPTVAMPDLDGDGNALDDFLPVGGKASR